MKIVVKKWRELAMQYNGTNFAELKKELKDSAGQIKEWMDGMLTIDTQHGRLTVRIGEWIVQDEEKCYQVYSNNEFQALFNDLYEEFL